jgi:hypothetical protein
MKYKKLVEFFNGDSNLAYAFNPHFQKMIYENKSPMPKRAKVLIPEKFKNELLKLVGSILPISSSSRKYSVERGDNLIRISKQFKISVRDLLAWNDLDHPNQIKVGQSLVVAQ